MLRCCLLVALLVGLLSPSHANEYPPSSPISYRTYAQMTKLLLQLNATFPDVVQVSIAQETYNLPYPEELQCQIDDETKTSEPCKQFVVHLTNHSTLASDPERPEVFISGALHGNERVGPNTAIELIELLAHATSIYATNDELKPTVETQRWLKELVNSRNVLVTPMTNAYGYSHNHREELQVDPNRDYNYMRSGAQCMQTMTSRVVNEIWRDHIFQLAVTFHGGTRAVSYEWGSPDHYLNGDEKKPSEKSPDHMAQFQIGNTLANFAGVFPDGKLYPTGTMNDVVYGVTGGMEDWGYAASWENQFYSKEIQPFHPCEPTTFGGYPKEKTVYNNITHRAFNMLVETSNNKEPSPHDLGNQSELYKANVDFFRTERSKTEFVGHVPRNVRLALMMIEMVQPIVRWVDAGVSSVTTNQELVTAFPTASLYTTSKANQVTEMGCGALAWERKEVATCNATECVVADPAVSKVQIAWEILGALTVDSTHVQVSSSATFEDDSILMETSTQKGTTRRFYEFASDSSQAATANADTMGTSLFVTCIDLRNVTSDQLYVRAIATVDQDWKSQSTGVDAPSPHAPPQSHLVNARTNPDWNFEWNGHRVKAALEWTSPIITVSTAKSSKTEASMPTGVPVSQPVPSLASNASINHDSEDDEDSVEALTPSNELAKSASADEEESEDLSDGVSGTIPPSSTAPIVEPSSTKATAEDSDESDDEEESEDSEEDEEDVTTLDDEIKASTLKPSSAGAFQNATALAANGSKLDDKDSSSSLVQVGYLIMSSCAMIIVLTLAYLYRRVFRRSRLPYMNISSLEQPTRVTINSINDEDYDVEDDNESDDGEGPRIPRHAQTSRGVL